MFEKISAWLNEHPTISLGIALFAALLIGGLIMRRQSPTEPAPIEDTTGDLSGLETVDGVPVLYRQTQSIFYNISSIEDSYNQSTTTNQTPRTDPGTPGTPPTPQQPLPSGWNCTYTVRGGDTLSGIASQYGTSWQDVYSHNKETIDSVAAQRGNPIPGGPQNNIFPGEVIHVPCR